MNADGTYPRVLFVTSHAFNHCTGGGVTFSSLFAGWPKDRLATVHNDPTPVTFDVCERYFNLGSDEIRKVGGLSRLARRSASRRDQRPASNRAPPLSDQIDRATARHAFKHVRAVLFGDAEIPETAHLSHRLRQWIADFRPEVLYTILGNNALIRLVELIRAEFGLPLAVHFMDDWKSTAYARGLLSPPRRRAMLNRVDRLVRTADVRMAISDAMSDAYGQEYGLPFATFQNAVEATEWSPTPPLEQDPGSAFTLFYGGAILPFAQLQSLVDVCRAVDTLDRQGQPIRFDIYAPATMVEACRNRLAVGSSIHVHPLLDDHEAYVRELRRADLLVLPINFDETSRQFIRYSMPTKVPEYLYSGVPVLVYGPPDVAQIQYARAERWGHVLTEPGPEGVARCIRRLAADDDLRRSVLPPALATARRNHDAAVVRDRFRAALLEACSGHALGRAR